MHFKSKLRNYLLGILMLGNVFELLQNETALVLQHRVSESAVPKFIELSCQELASSQIP